MGRILCFDYGLKRTGIAATDPLQLIAGPLETVATKELMPFVVSYVQREEVSLFIVSEPLNLDDSETDATRPANNFAKGLMAKFPQIPVLRWDERYTSKMASRSLVEMGMKKKDRQSKGNIDLVAATLMLQEYLDSRTT